MNETLTQDIYISLYNERETLENFLYHRLREKNAINDPLRYNANKLIVLRIAQHVGSKIPSTLLSNVVPEITETSYWYSLFQEKIEKKYELRIFYFQGKIHAAAIFFQMDKR